ncbi:agmatine deiminase family protein [Chryseolinea lacunae]|uniref:Agmatine deiminase family protein n=1 Tax=Chryseolinea lacunae TaxID=2801331 RepID=A0ABS1KK38_9BACT|nr:agmatine deiminase family protein [Chryseolinea lacunae]MBL0739811.1 agmatine deiminase family protein [Chryseolinea lacunae]
MNILFRFLLIVVVAASCAKPEKTDFYMPAEWEPHDAVWLGWEDEYESYHPVVFNVIHALMPHVQVKIAVDSDSLMRVAKHILSEHSIDTTRLQFYVMPGERYWIRDHGAAFLVNSKGELGVADFAWNGYGYPQWLQEKFDNNVDSVNKYFKPVRTKMTGQVDSLMAIAENATALKTWVAHEGGAIEVNGKGTLILCEATVFKRNPGKSKEELEPEFKRVLGVNNIIWMKQGLADDPWHFMRRIADNYVGGGTGGHTDEFVRFANANTILLAWVDEEEKALNTINKMNHERMSENLEILEAARDQDGKSFNIVKVPLPDLVAKKVVARETVDDWKTSLDMRVRSFKASEAPHAGDTVLRVPASSYMNYLVTNGLVLVPTYTNTGSSPEKEERVRKIFATHFPGREIVFIDAMALNWSGGGIHCSTQQQPQRKK